MNHSRIKYTLSSVNNGLASLHNEIEFATMNGEKKCEVLKLLLQISLSINSLMEEIKDEDASRDEFHFYIYTKGVDGFYAYFHNEDILFEKPLCPVCFDTRNKMIHLIRMSINQNNFRCPKCNAKYEQYEKKS